MDLKEELIQKREQDGFISIGFIKRLITLKRAQAHFKARQIETSEALTSTALSNRGRITTILILLDLESYFEKFVQMDLSDAIFPVTESDIRLFTDDDDRNDFITHQWVIPLPFYTEKHVDLPSMAILPFTSKKRISHGSFGMVYKVCLAEGYSIANQGHEIAMKTIEYDETKDEVVLMREVYALRKWSHDNIVPLLASFTQINTESSADLKALHLLLPYAKYDMETWMGLGVAPLEVAEKSRDAQRMGLYRSTYELVSALSFLHRTGSDGLHVPHYDLKPKNILVFGQKWMISDFGLARLRDSIQGSETEGQGGLGSYDYHPPEYYNDDGTRAERGHGRPFDIWAMGCIMLQVAVLVVYGWEKRMVERFRRARSQQSPSFRRFHKMDEDQSFHNNLHVVGLWLSELGDGSSMLRRFLQIIIQMLRQDPKDRLTSWEAELDLHELLYPDQTTRERYAEGKKRIPQRRGVDLGPFNTLPLHRAAETGNVIRAICLPEAGWSWDQSCGMGNLQQSTPGLENDVQFWNQLQEAAANGDYNSIFKLRDKYFAPYPLHENEQTGFRLRYNFSTRPRSTDPGWEPRENGETSNMLHENTDESFVLHQAILEGDGERVKHILERSPDPDVLTLEKNEYGKVAIHLAVENGSLLIASQLLDAVRDKSTLLKMQDASGQTPLQLAYSSGNPQLARLLVQRSKLK